MEELLKMIWTHWQSDACAELRDKLPGGFWAWQAPGESLRDGDAYGIYTIVSGAETYTNSSVIDQYLVQLSFYDNSDNAGQEIASIRDYVIAAWDDVALTIDDSKFGDEQRLINFRRQTTGAPVKDPDEGYAVNLDYAVWVSIG